MTFAQAISTLFILGKVLPKATCPHCFNPMRVRGDDNKSKYYHYCKSCGHKAPININSRKIRKLIDKY